MKQVIKLFDFKQEVDYKNEILSGLTVDKKSRLFPSGL